jgi:hypothetical protein
LDFFKVLNIFSIAMVVSICFAKRQTPLKKPARLADTAGGRAKIIQRFQTNLQTLSQQIEPDHVLKIGNRSLKRGNRTFTLTSYELGVLGAPGHNFSGCLSVSANNKRTRLMLVQPNPCTEAGQNRQHRFMIGNDGQVFQFTPEKQWQPATDDTTSSTAYSLLQQFNKLTNQLLKNKDKIRKKAKMPQFERRT